MKEGEFIMKRIISFVLFIGLLISFVPNVFANDNFKVSHTVIEDKDDVKDIHLVLPIFERFNGADEVNKKILNIALDAIGDANSTAKSMLDFKKELIEKGESADSIVASLDMTYDYFKLGEILSVQLNIYSYFGGAHGINHKLSITSNTSTGEIYEFKDLFKENIDYSPIINNYIIEEVENDLELYFPNYTKNLSLDGKYNYYIDGNKLVIYFGLYDIAPYAVGIRHFMIDSHDIKDILKDEVYNSIKDGCERGVINFNGKDINSDKAIINNNDTPLLPLRVIAEASGYKVEWHEKDGAIVDGKPVSIRPRIVKNDTIYVPLSYFRNELGDKVSLGLVGNDKMIVRAYGNDSEISNLRLMKEYESPETAQSAVNIYAEAVKMRNGMVQYALLDDSLREEKYEEFKSLGFVTDTSSPWVDSYEITQLEENLYKIKFTYRTSVPSDGIYTSEIDLRLIEDGQHVKITSYVEN